MLYYSMNDHPKQMFDQVVEIKLLNDNVIFADKLVGSFKMDLGSVYSQDGESPMNETYFPT